MALKRDETGENWVIHGLAGSYLETTCGLYVGAASISDSLMDASFSG